MKTLIITAAAVARSVHWSIPIWRPRLRQASNAIWAALGSQASNVERSDAIASGPSEGSLTHPLIQKIQMYTRLLPVCARSILAVIAIAGTLFAGVVAADDHGFIVAIPVNARGLDLNQPAGAQELYRRLDYAAYVACTRANRVGLAPSPDVRGCSEKALADAVRAANMPLLTHVYLARHTLREAVASGIEVPAELAAK